MWKNCFALLIFLSISGNVLGKNIKTTSDVLKELSCPAEGINLNDDQPWNWITYYHNIPAWEQCGELCQGYPECKGWSWNSEEPDQGECNLWKDSDKTNEVRGKISGLRDCPEEY